MKRHKGFIDLHTHGIGRYDTRTAEPEDILKIAELHGKAGTAAILPTIYSSDSKTMRSNIGAVKKAMRVQQNSSCVTDYASRILGVHIEGPFLNPVRCGALDKSSFLKPSISSFRKLIDGYGDVVKLVTIAPEIPGAMRLIEFCSGNGISVNMGHSDATFKEAMDGKKSGATGITHLFNAMRPFHHREPGLAGFGLIDRDIYTEVIADGVHLSIETLKIVFNIKDSRRIILVSDSVKNQKRGPVYEKSGVLAGSGITISDSVKLLKSIGVSNAGISNASFHNPTRYLSI